jgi:hypothetical protein
MFDVSLTFLIRLSFPCPDPVSEFISSFYWTLPCHFSEVQLILSFT